MTSSKLNYFPKAPSPNTITLRIKLSTCGFEEVREDAIQDTAMMLKAVVSLKLWKDFGCRDSSENEGGALSLYTYIPLQYEASEPQHC